MWLFSKIHLFRAGIPNSHAIFTWALHNLPNLALFSIMLQLNRTVHPYSAPVTTSLPRSGFLVPSFSHKSIPSTISVFEILTWVTVSYSPSTSIKLGNTGKITVMPTCRALPLHLQCSQLAFSTEPVNNNPFTTNAALYTEKSSVKSRVLNENFHGY